MYLNFPPQPLEEQKSPSDAGGEVRESGLGPGQKGEPEEFCLACWKDDLGQRLRGTRWKPLVLFQRDCQTEEPRQKGKVPKPAPLLAPPCRRGARPVVITPPFTCCSPGLPASKQFSFITSCVWNFRFIFLVFCVRVPHQIPPTSPGLVIYSQDQHRVIIMAITYYSKRI